MLSIGSNTFWKTVCMWYKFSFLFMVHRTTLMWWWMYRMWVNILTLELITKLSVIGFSRRWPQVVAFIYCQKFLTKLHFCVWSPQKVGVSSRQSVLFCWATSTFVFNLYSWWVLTLCHEIGFILLSDLCFGASSLQKVSVDFVPWNWFSFAKWPLLWCLISTVCECWLCAMKLVLFCWVTSASLQKVSVNFVPWNWFSFAEWPLLWCLIPTESECWLCVMKLVLFY